jgi:hypothetical protein
VRRPQGHRLPNCMSSDALDEDVGVIGRADVIRA